MKEEENGQTIEAQIELVTRALAPVLLPMIDSLGALEIESALSIVESGESDLVHPVSMTVALAQKTPATEDLLQFSYSRQA